MYQKKRTHIATEDRYELLRIKARHASFAALPIVMTNGFGQGINIKGEVTFRGIDNSTLFEIRRWMSSPQRRIEIGIAWSSIIAKYMRTAPKRFELGIWHRDSLSGIAVGQPTWSGGKLRLDFLEACPQSSPLVGLISEITVINLIFYAREIGASQIRVMSPVNTRVRQHYLQSGFGFSYDERGNYCYRNL